MNGLILALDVGTTGVRALLFDSTGTPCGGSYEELQIDCPQPGWVETDPVGMWQATQRVIRGAIDRAGAPPASITAVGVANQRATTVLWHRDTGQPVHSAIVWQDLRTADRVRELLQRGVFANTMASATKVQWLLETVPAAGEAAARGRLCFGTVDSWIVWNLTGGHAHVTDHSNASCTGLYDFASAGWDTLTLDALHIPASVLPEIRASSVVYAETTEDSCGFVTPVAAVAGDQQAAMFGQLRMNRGELKITLGTSAMADVNCGALPVLPSEGTYPLVLWALGRERVFCLEGTAVTAGAAVHWLRDGLGVIAGAGESSAVAQQVPDCGDVWAIPAFQGLGTPYMDASARAVIGGLSRATSRAHVVRAVLEGIAFRCRQVTSALMAAMEADLPEVLRVDGGAADNDFLAQFLADATGAVIERPATVQATALGVAYLAGMATGVWAGMGDLREAWKLGRRFEPRWSADERQGRFERWCRNLELVRGHA